jgi:hypothetical protein
MTRTTKKYLIGLMLLVGAGAGGVVYSAEAALGKDAYKTAQQRIEGQAKAQRQACGRFKANAKDVCEAQAKGWEKVAKAQLEVQYKPGPEAEKKAKFARADADYGVAKQRCEALKDRAHDTCIAQAKHDREAAVRLAKVEKVEEVNALRREEHEQRTGHAKPAAAPAAHKS